MADHVARLTPAGLGALVDTQLEGAARDAAIASLRSASRRLRGGAFDPSSAEGCRRAGRLIRGLRNAAVHGTVLTTDRHMAPILGLACLVLDEAVVRLYAQVFELTEAQVSQALDSREEDR